jgi:predicted DCC family thiol-disulfide oxidoreductase YuxK
MENQQQQKTGVSIIYDGECPVCSYYAHALRIKENAGGLQLIDARENADHPFIKEINSRKLDLDEGMVLVYRDVFYHGQDALHMMALLGSNHGLFNKINALLFSSKTVSKVCYPFLRGARNLLLRLRGVQKLNNLER